MLPYRNPTHAILSPLNQVTAWAVYGLFGVMLKQHEYAAYNLGISKLLEGSVFSGRYRGSSGQLFDYFRLTVGAFKDFYANRAQEK